MLKKLSKKGKNRFKKLNKKTLGLLAILGGLLLLSGSSGVRYSYPHTTEEFANTSVMITNMQETSGGSGTIIRSARGHSVILTNRHVCQVVEHGGIINHEGSKYVVSAFKESNEHDLCEILVKADLNVNLKVARSEPKIYSNAYISGHPKLMPFILTKGHFSGKLTISVMTGFKKCTSQDFGKMKDPNDQLICLFTGLMADIKDYPSQVVSATILPGSSGSAVFDENGEIAGVAFASSSRELSYAYIVPQEYVAKFVSREAEALSWAEPTQEPDQSNTEHSSYKL